MVSTTTKPIAPAATSGHTIVRSVTAANPIKVNVPIAPAQVRYITDLSQPRPQGLRRSHYWTLVGEMISATQKIITK